MEVRPLLVCHLSRNRLMLNPWRSGYCDLNKGECYLNQSKEDSFLKLVAKNNNWNNGDRHKIHEIFLFNCFVFVIILVWQTVHSSAVTQITANLMEKTLQLTVPCRVTVLALVGLAKKHFGHYAVLKMVSVRSPKSFLVTFAWSIVERLSHEDFEHEIWNNLIVITLPFLCSKCNRTYVLLYYIHGVNVKVVCLGGLFHFMSIQRLDVKFQSSPERI